MTEHCRLCRRLLDNPADCLSLDCGGDCEACMIEAVQDTTVPENAGQDELLAWRDHWRAVNADLAEYRWQVTAT